MKQITTLPNGVKVEVTENGCNVISTTGKCIKFNENGEICEDVLTSTESVNKASFVKHFFSMEESERKLVVQWYKEQKGETKNQKEFLTRVAEAVDTVTYNYSIATIEPSEDENGKIYYEVGKPVLRALNYNKWLKKAKEFMPEMGSDLANLHELDLWYAYRIAKGYWTIEYVCDDSSSDGNYRNAPNATHDFETSGARTVGGFADGVGNTYKLVKGLKYGFLLCGGDYNVNGDDYPVADAYHNNYTYLRRNYSSGCIVLRSNTDY